MMVGRKASPIRRRLAFLAGSATVLALVAAAAPPARAAELTVTVKGTDADRQKVNLKIIGQLSGTTQTKRTGAGGTVKFSVPADTYKVTPTKSGFRFTPSARSLTLPAGTRVAASFNIQPLPAVKALTASQTAVTLRQTLTTEVVLTAVDSAGNGIMGAQVKAASSDTVYVRAEPASAVTDALGRATFTLTAFGSIPYSNAAEISVDPIGAASVTFTTGGWRGTAVRTATTAVTVLQGLEGELWVTSGHADFDAMAFRDWDDSGTVSASCTRCHTKTGFVNLVTGQPAVGVPVGEVIDCFLCHDPAAWALTQVTFPSGAVVTGLTREAICMTCHQGRASTNTVNTRVAGMPLDDVNATLTFANIHYFAAAATQFGTVAKGGYEYTGLEYDRRAPHVSSKNVCHECHNQHSLALRLEDCRTCHPAATDYAGVKTIRMAASTSDYDGDGDVTEGVAAEAEAMAAILYGNIRAYAEAKGFPIVYDGHTYPYWFNDANNNGLMDAGETGYNNWTPRLLEAAYNYQVYQKDPGRTCHNAKYIFQLLYDSTASLDEYLGTTVAAGLARNDGAHFNTTSHALRNWDPGPVGASCGRCHSGEAGFRAYTEGGYPSSVPNMEPVSRFACETCHTGTGFAGSPPRRFVDRVIWPTFTGDPAPLVVFNDPTNPDDSFICMTCHQGRQSKKTYDNYLAGFTDDQILATQSFQNLHYLSAGGTLYGKQAGVGYEYAGKTYNLKFNHWGGESPRCFYCHDVSGARHTFLPRLVPVCSNCHTEIVNGDIRTIRLNRPYDYDGDGNTTETLKAEMDGLRDALFAQMRLYAAANGGAIVYSPDLYPYYFYDANDNGLVDTGEGAYTGRWTPRLMRAAHNYHMTQKEPGYWSHNTNYTAQLLIDSNEDLGGNVSGFERPVGF